jgi:hypothetical protein
LFNGEEEKKTLFSSRQKGFRTFLSAIHTFPRKNYVFTTQLQGQGKGRERRMTAAVVEFLFSRVATELASKKFALISEILLMMRQC